MAKKRPTKPTPVRHFPRIPAQTSVLLRKLGGPVKGALTTTRVVGLGGCSFIHHESEGVGSTLFLSILMGHDLAEAKARVVYENRISEGQYEIGVEFLEIQASDREKLERLVASTAAADGAGRP
jgi:hypothetical protein